MDGLSHGEAPSEYEQHREAEIEAAGWQVLRFANRQVLDDLDGVLREIAGAVRESRGL